MVDDVQQREYDISFGTPRRFKRNARYLPKNDGNDRVVTIDDLTAWSVPTFGPIPRKIDN